MTRFEAYKKKFTIDSFSNILADVDCVDCPLYHTDRCNNILCFNPKSWKEWLLEEVEDEILLNFDLYDLEAALMLLDIESEHVDLIVEDHNIYMVKKA